MVCKRERATSESVEGLVEELRQYVGPGLWCPFGTIPGLLYPFGNLLWLNCPTAGDQDWIHVVRRTKAISLDVPVQVVAGTNETLQYVIDID